MPIGPTRPIGDLSSLVDQLGKAPPVRLLTRPNLVQVYRPDDMFTAELKLVSGRSGAATRLVLSFGSQHLAESAKPAAGQPSTISGRRAAASRLAFMVPDNLDLLSGSLAELLEALTHLAPAVAPQADTPIKGVEALKAPGEATTAVALPWRLVMSPSSLARFRHRPLPVRVGGRTALWQTQAADPQGGVQLRAIWSDDWPVLGADQDVGILLARHRRDLVFMTAVSDESAPSPPAIRADDFSISPLGGGLRLDAVFAPKRVYPTLPEFFKDPAFKDSAIKKPLETTLTGWSHRIVFGRDMTAKTVARGILAPFGHDANLTTVHERKVIGGLAVIEVRQFLSVSEPIVRVAGLSFPFVEVEALDRFVEVTPQSDPNNKLVLVNNEQFAMRFRLRDHAGRDHHIAVGIAWANSNSAEGLPGVYTKSACRQFSKSGLLMRLADDSRADVVLDAISHICEFNAETKQLRPLLDEVIAEVPGSGEFDGVRQTFKARLGAYADAGDKAAGDKAKALLVRAENIGAPHLFTNQGKLSGGLAALDLAVHGLSIERGVITGPASAMAKDVADALAAISNPLDPLDSEALTKLVPAVKLLGIIDLKDVLARVKAGKEALPKLQRVTSKDEVVLNFSQAFNGPSEPSEPNGETIMPVAWGFEFILDKGFHFGFSTQIRAAVGNVGKLPETTNNAEMRNFALAFKLGDKTGIRLNVLRLGFRAEFGKKPDFLFDLANIPATPEMPATAETPAKAATPAKSPIAFTGALAFVQRIAQLMPASAFSDPPDIQVKTEGVTARYTLALPPLQFGAFALSDLSLSAGFQLPFVGGSPMLRLAIADRSAPFSLLVAILGGGGYVAFELDLGGIRAFELTLEAQAGIVLNLGVAKGAVFARIGIYFRLELSDTATSITLEAFVEISGAVCVIGIITVSIVSRLVLGYRNVGGSDELYGIATVKVGVKLLFIKKTVTFAIERTFAGSGGDPSFTDVHSLESFGQYWDAFA